MKGSAFFLIALLFFSMKSNAADLAGLPCETLGTTKLDDNAVNIIACLHTSTTNGVLIWKATTIPASYVANKSLTTGQTGTYGVACYAMIDATGKPYLAGRTAAQISNGYPLSWSAGELISFVPADSTISNAKPANPTYTCSLSPRGLTVSQSGAWCENLTNCNGRERNPLAVFYPWN